MNYKKLNIKDDKGLTLLLAVLVATLVLAVGISIINLSLKQLSLSGATRESQLAFYAANTGIECAMFWNYNKLTGQDGVIFATSSDSVVVGDGNGVNKWLGTVDVTCAGGNEIMSADSNWVAGNGTKKPGVSSFRINFNKAGDGIEYCADVVVTKEEVSVPGGTRIQTTIQSYGYNTCVVDNPRRVERGIEVTI